MSRQENQNKGRIFYYLVEIVIIAMAVSILSKLFLDESIWKWRVFEVTIPWTVGIIAVNDVSKKTLRAAFNEIGVMMFVIAVIVTFVTGVVLSLNWQNHLVWVEVSYLLSIFYNIFFREYQ